MPAPGGLGLKRPLPTRLLLMIAGSRMGVRRVQAFCRRRPAPVWAQCLMGGAQGHVGLGHGRVGAADDAGARRRQHGVVNRFGHGFFHRWVMRLTQPAAVEAGAAQLFLELDPMEGILVRAEQAVHLAAQVGGQGKPASIKLKPIFGLESTTHHFILLAGVGGGNLQATCMYSKLMPMPIWMASRTWLKKFSSDFLSLSGPTAINFLR